MKHYDPPKMTLLRVDLKQDVFTSGEVIYNSLNEILDRKTDVYDAVDW